MKLYSGPLVDGGNPGRRALRNARGRRAPPAGSHRLAAAPHNWYRRITLLTVMQQADHSLAFDYRRGLIPPFRRGLRTAPAARPVDPRVPAHRQPGRPRLCAAHSDGIPLNSLLESLLNMSVTAHILGGCQIGPHGE